jgi:hypothetical protein
MSNAKLHQHLASFDSRPLGTAQDEGHGVWQTQNVLILSRPRSGRVEGRTMPAYREETV